MHTLPQILEEDICEINEALEELLKRSDSTLAILTDKAGYRITMVGEPGSLDPTSLASLAAGSFLASRTIAGMLGEKAFNSNYQQGESSSMLILDVDEWTLLIVIFPNLTAAAGSVKFYAAPAMERISKSLKAARDRAPGKGLNLSMLDLPDSGEIFRRKP